MCLLPPANLNPSGIFLIPYISPSLPSPIRTSIPLFPGNAEFPRASSNFRGSITEAPRWILEAAPGWMWGAHPETPPAAGRALPELRRRDLFWECGAQTLLRGKACPGRVGRNFWSRPGALDSGSLGGKGTEGKWLFLVFSGGGNVPMEVGDGSLDVWEGEEAGNAPKIGA